MSGQESINPFNLAIIGCGTLATPLLENVLKEETKSPVKSFHLTVNSKTSITRLKSLTKEYTSSFSSITIDTDNLAALKNADVVFLACKPYQVADVLGTEDVRIALEGKSIITVIAGWSSERLFDFLTTESTTKPPSIIKANPNIAASTSTSTTVIEAAPPSSPWAPSPYHLQIANHIFSLSGTVHSFSTGPRFDSASALAGMGPAFLSTAVDGLLDGAVWAGIKRSEAKSLTAGVLRGLASLIESDVDPADVRERTASPGGTTIRGLVALEKGGVRVGFTDAYVTAVERARAMEQANEKK